jgi:elongation factor 1-gamma
VAKFAGVPVETAANFTFGVTNKTAEFKSKFPLGKVPAFEAPEGPLFESNAIAYYMAAAHKPEFLGKTPYEMALVQQFLAFADNELCGPIAAWYYPLAGYAPLNEAMMKKGKEDLLKVLGSLDKILLPRTFLVGERITLADIVVACTLCNTLGKLLEPADRESIVNVVRWFVTCANQPAFKEVIGAFNLCVKTMEPVKPAEPKKEEAKKAEHDEEAEEAVAAPTGFNLEAWKRFYSNNPARPTAIDYFWANYEPENYSAWRVAYKYPEELRQVFMTCNLIGGLFHSMEVHDLRKVAFGVLGIFGENNNNEIQGAFIFRGQELPGNMSDVTGFESYSWEKMDLSKPEDKEIFEDFLADEGNFKGISRPFNQAKDFK